MLTVCLADPGLDQAEMSRSLLGLFLGELL